MHRQEVITRVAIVLVWICVNLKSGRADGTFHVLFDHFDNPTGEASNGHCCDGRWGICERHGCDYLFTICLGDTSNTNTAEECAYGKKVSTRVKNHDNVDFGSTVGNLSNPMFFSFSGAIPGHVVIKIDVYDKDNQFTSNDFVDFLAAVVPLYTSSDPWEQSAFTAHGTRAQERTSLTGELWIDCAEDWYGESCGQYCQPPEVPYNYRCDPDTGHKVCEPDWSGADCWEPVGPSTTTQTTAATTTMSTTTTTVPNPSTTSSGVEFVNRANADCDNLAKNGYRYQDGVYELRVADYAPFRAYCDMSHVGWTVIQRRLDGSQNFYRSWDEYVDGFGDLEPLEEHWLGLRNIYLLTNQRPYKLRITMRIGNGEFRYAEYEHFYIDNEDKNFALHVEGFSGNAGDALQFVGFGGMRRHDGMPFSTFDRDNDNWGDDNCAEVYGSGWWFNDCYWANLNGVFVEQTNGWPICTDGRCVSWRTIQNYEDFSLVMTEMKILPNPDLETPSDNHRG